jgi:hypothetical protein
MESGRAFTPPTTTRLTEDVVESVAGVSEMNNNLKASSDEVLRTARSGASVL